MGFQEENSLIYNRGLNPLVNYNFMLRVEAIYDLPCKSVRAFTKENEYESIQEGGLNDYVHLRRKPISQPFKLQIERYVGVDYFDPMPNGAELVLPVILMITRWNDVARFVKDKRVYTFTGCTVMGKEFGELNAEQSGLLTEITTLSYREMLCVDVPWDYDELTDPWKFKKPDETSESKATPDFKGVGSFARTPVDEKRKKDLKDLSKKWSFKQEKKEETTEVSLAFRGSNQSAKRNESEVNKDKMVSKKWSFKQEKKEETTEVPLAFRGSNRSARPPKIAEIRKTELVKKSKKWVGPKKEAGSFGGEKQSAVQPQPKELRKTDLVKKARKWPKIQNARQYVPK